uniref:Zinc finger CCHC domain-containing protein 17 n=1 Tax=Cairina moschata TaxID=8855 RepID=A0A8C3BU74_CAIMO
GSLFVPGGCLHAHKTPAVLSCPAAPRCCSLTSDDSTEGRPGTTWGFCACVASVTEYGAFIKIPGCRKQGLVHKTHMSSCRVDKPSEMVDVGDKVWVKVIGKEMKDDKLKLSLSMKVVNQGTGKDLDPNNVALDQDERKKRMFRDYTSQKITLEAVLNTGFFLLSCHVRTEFCFAVPFLEESYIFPHLLCKGKS